MILVSACLVGLNTKYNGGNNFDDKIFELVKKGVAIPICPEQLGGLSTPRLPSEIINNKVYNKNNKDLTSNFVKGAEEVLKLAKELNIKIAILKSKSPSCGKGIIYDGTFSSNLTNGNGITTQLLIDNGIEVISSDDDKKIEELLNNI
ncbi:MAG: DUF523 domain-containing protein [Bacilli bacterium]|nr:DUF523 domain-containing protein [Bacilli bacterium]